MSPWVLISLHSYRNMYSIRTSIYRVSYINRKNDVFLSSGDSPLSFVPQKLPPHRSNNLRVSGLCTVHGTRSRHRAVERTTCGKRGGLGCCQVAGCRRKFAPTKMGEMFIVGFAWFCCFWVFFGLKFWVGLWWFRLSYMYLPFYLEKKS